MSRAVRRGCNFQAMTMRSAQSMMTASRSLGPDQSLKVVMSQAQRRLDLSTATLPSWGRPGRWVRWRCEASQAWRLRW